MFCWTRCLCNPYMSNNRTIISLFDVESQIFVTMATRASLSKFQWHHYIVQTQRTTVSVWCKILFISFISRLIGNFLLIFPNFRYRGNKGRSGGSKEISMTPLNCTTSNPISDARFLTVSLIIMSHSYWMCCWWVASRSVRLHWCRAGGRHFEHTL